MQIDLHHSSRLSPCPGGFDWMACPLYLFILNRGGRMLNIPIGSCYLRAQLSHRPKVFPFLMWFYFFKIWFLCVLLCVSIDTCIIT